MVERDDVDVNSKDDYGRTLLSIAAAGGHEAVVKLLVERDDIRREVEGQRGPDVAIDSSSGGHEAVVKLLRSKTISEDMKVPTT